jgi:alkyl hydroperoxide reductase subunit F
MKNVTIFSTPNCIYCQMTKEFLKEHNIAYTEHDVAADPEQRAKMIEASEQMGVPVTIIDDNVVIGFDKGALSQLLGIAA